MEKIKSNFSVGACAECGPENYVTHQTVTLAGNDGWCWVFRIECACGEIGNYRHLRETSGELQGSLDWDRVMCSIRTRKEVPEIL